MNYRSVSAKSVIAKVYRDLKPNTDNWVGDAVEWIGEALEYIGTYTGLIKKAREFTVANHRTLIPCELVDIIQVEYNGRALPYGSDVTGYDLPNASRTTTMSPSSGQPGVTTSATYETTTDFLSNFTPIAQRKTSASRYPTADYYVLNPDYLQTSFEEGTVKIHYTAYPVCDDGYPKIPDNIYYKQALEWYILRQMLMGGYVHPIFKWETADAKWGEYCLKAQNDGMFPSIDKMESFKNMWVRMVPNINAHSDFFIGNNTQEQLDR